MGRKRKKKKEEALKSFKFMEYSFWYSFNAQFNSPMLFNNDDNQNYFSATRVSSNRCRGGREGEEFIILIFYINSNEKAKAEENKNAHLIHIALKPTVDPLKK